ncbi:GNAT family N-acetyltransferase [Nocardioides euryhalodurans]|uniref:GNAT family N-acetyltransferase n=1 Tax=Nocardioides euryhalodurans TaxID=2518370 RepID=A0A4P7GPQ4_9ACTN|nr:GNAT family N-acetyltransferase [Nocardioides euryhalodurans]QBR94120.1 GNAT family N-acetyltransferase [Nocardioides euryhalodurans]
MLTTRHGVRVLGASDLDAFQRLASVDPVVNVFASYRARTTNLEPRWLGGEVWGRFVDGELCAACHVGANLVPVQASPDDARVFAERALARGRTVTTIVGPQDAVRPLWETVAESWGPAREQRWDQPHLEIGHAPQVAPDPLVRRTTLADLDVLYPACVAMYTEEVGVSPEAGGGADLYRTRVHQLVSRGWSFARVEDGEVVFKAEVASVTPYAAQVQGVWVSPSRRGEGLGAAGMAAVVEAVRSDVAPVVSLYVNDFNHAARRVYERVGFARTATFATIMF